MRSLTRIATTLFATTTIAMMIHISHTQAGPIVDAAKKAEDLANEGKAVAAVFAIDAAIDKLWRKVGMNIVAANFVTERPKGYGSYKPNEKPIYKAGQDMIVYTEVIGYGYGSNGGKFSVDLNVDMEVKNKAGKVLGGKKNFLKLNHAGRIPVREFFSVITYNFNGIPPGDYTVTTKLNDQNADQWAAFDLEFTIVK